MVASKWLRHLAAALLLLSSTPPLRAQEPVKDRGVTPADENESPATGRLLLAVIGIDDYLHWPKLDNAVSDALGLQRALVEKAGVTMLVEPLLNDRATKSAILSFLEDDLRQKLEPDDQLIVFFAGHGHTRVSKVGEREIETGFLVPVEAHAGAEERWSGYIGIDEFLKAVNLLPARHILVILDACHSGFALGGAIEKFRGTEEFQRQLSEKVSRRAITSAGRDQLASDSGPLPEHSLFTGSFVQGLRFGTMDRDANGLITSSEIGVYLQSEVGQASGSRQTPDFGAFGLDDRGELTISLRNQSFDAVFARAMNALQNGLNKEFSERVSELEAIQATRPEALYAKYRLGVVSGDVDAAIEAVEALSSSPFEPGSIPFGQEDLWDLRQALPFWKDVLKLEESSAELDVAVVLTTGTSVVPEPLGDVEVYTLPGEADYRIRITNQSQETRFVHLLLVSEAGRIKPVRLWEFGANFTGPMFQGLKPGETLESIPLRKAGTAGIEELRLIVSPSLIQELVIPPDAKSRAVIRIEPQSLEAIARSMRHTLRLVAKRDAAPTMD